MINSAHNIFILYSNLILYLYFQKENNRNLLIKLNVKIKKLKILKFWNDRSYIDNGSFFEPLYFILYLIMTWKIFLVQQLHESRSVWNSMRFLLISYASQLYSRFNRWRDLIKFIGINQRIWEYFAEYSLESLKIALI